MQRRTFMKNGVMAAFAAGISHRVPAERSPENSDLNLIPSHPSQAPNYFCSWGPQNSGYDPKVALGDAGAALARNALNEERVFGQEGWAKTFSPEIRKDLYFLFDDGWESGGAATFLLDTQKFPSFSGSPENRLRKLNDAICERGWRGAALWCRNTPGGRTNFPLVERSKNAGIRYWKIDGGDRGFDVDQVRDELHALLTTEHVYGEVPLNGDWHKDGRFEPQTWDSPRVEILRRTDVYRTYDTISVLSVPTTLDRVSQLLQAVQGHPEVHGLLNVEDEPYIAAVLGCTMGIMRSPLHGSRLDGGLNLGFAGPRSTKKRMDEVIRAIHWQRVAAPYASGNGFVRLDSEILTDEWVFRAGETWYPESLGQRARQGAPARISRNIELPLIQPYKDKPFICAGRFPSGAVAIGSYDRVRLDDGEFMPRAAATLEVKGPIGPVGIFGRFEAVNLVFDEPLRSPRLLGQDLKGGLAMDITKDVKINGREVCIPGDLISTVGLLEAASGDHSSPGMVLKIA